MEPSPTAVPPAQRDIPTYHTARRSAPPLMVAGSTVKWLLQVCRHVQHMPCLLLTCRIHYDIAIDFEAVTKVGAGVIVALDLEVPVAGSEIVDTGHPQLPACTWT
jgi:hypothetical protein